MGLSPCADRYTLRAPVVADVISKWKLDEGLLGLQGWTQLPGINLTLGATTNLR